MAEDLQDAYPLVAYNYRVTIEETVLGFSEVSGLSVQYEPVTYKHGLSFLTGSQIIRGMRQPVRVTLKRGMAKDRKFLSDWFYEANTSPAFVSKSHDIVIDLCDASSVVIVRWTVQKALPIKLDAPAFAVESSSVAIESLEVIAQDIQIEYNP